MSFAFGSREAAESCQKFGAYGKGEIVCVLWVMGPYCRGLLFIFFYLSSGVLIYS